MSPDRLREIASRGGKLAHAQGKAHEFTSEEGREAGRIGGAKVAVDREHMREIGKLGALARRNRCADPKPEELEKLRLERESLAARLREKREQFEREQARRRSAGEGSALHDAIVERLPADVVAGIERAALAKLAKRERKHAKSKAGG
jgi:hypothetical protein